jgi:hypothetical protein
MKALLNRSFEKLHRNKVYVTKGTRETDVLRLMQELKPVGNQMSLQRFGPEGDGGYLIPDDLDGILACISPGVSTECGFDLAIAERGIEVFMADASVDGPSLPHPKFHFLKKYLDIYNSDTTITLEEFCNSIPHYQSGHDLMLQMDIEAAEYRVLPGITDQLLKRFRIMVIEFHNLDNIFAKFFFDIFRITFSRLTKYHYVAHLHPNNGCFVAKRGDLHIPQTMEFTFHRKNRASIINNQVVQFPHPLDADNVAGGPPLALPSCWYKPRT